MRSAGVVRGAAAESPCAELGFRRQIILSPQLAMVLLPLLSISARGAGDMAQPRTGRPIRVPIQDK